MNLHLSMVNLSHITPSTDDIDPKNINVHFFQWLFYFLEYDFIVMCLNKSFFVGKLIKMAHVVLQGDIVKA